MNAQDQHELRQIATQWARWVSQAASPEQVMEQLLSALVENITTTLHERMQADACRIAELERLVDLRPADAPSGGS